LKWAGGNKIQVIDRPDTEPGNKFHMTGAPDDGVQEVLRLELKN